LRTNWSLRIQNFGRISEAEIQISPMILFVGDNSSGKSYLMSLLWGMMEENYYDYLDIEECQNWEVYQNARDIFLNTVSKKEKITQKDKERILDIIRPLEIEEINEEVPELNFFDDSPQKSDAFSIKYGFSYIYNNKELLLLLISSSMINFFSSGINFYLPFINKMYDLDKLYGMILIGQAVGNIIGAVSNNFFKRSFSSNQYSTFLLISSLPLIMIPLVKIWSITLLLFSLSSLAMTIFNVQMLSYLQSTIEKEYLGRVFSIIAFFALMLMPLGTVVFSYFNFKTLLVFGVVGVGDLLTCILLKLALKSLK